MTGVKYANLLLFLTTLSLRGAVLDIVGNLTPTTVGFRSHKKSDPHLGFNFHLQRNSNGAYKLSFVFTDRIAGKSSDCILAYDTTNLFLLSKELIGTPPTFTTNSLTTVYVRHSPLPFVSHSPREGWPFLWMLFASDTLLDVSGFTNRPSIFEVPRSLETFGYDWVWNTRRTGSLFPDSLKIVRNTKYDQPLEVEMTNPEVDFPVSPDWLQYSERMYARRKRIPDGFVRTDVTVSKWSRLNGIEVPEVAVVTVHDPAQEGDFYRFDIVAEQIKTIDSELDMAVFPPGLITVWDERVKTLSKESAINMQSYTATNISYLPDLDAPWLKQLSTLNTYDARRKSIWMLRKWRHVISGFIIVLLLAWPAAAIVRSTLNGRKHKLS